MIFFNNFSSIFNFFQSKNINKTITINTISLTLIYALNFLISLITLPHLVKNYGLTQWGEIVFFQIFLNYLIWIVDWSFNQYSSKFISIYSKDKKFQIKIFRETWTAQLILTFIATFLIIFFSFINYKFSLLSIYFFLVIFGNFLQPIWFLNGLEKIYETALIKLINKIIFSSLILFLINEKSNIYEYFLYFSLGYLITGIFYQIRIFIHYRYVIGLSSFSNGYKTLKKSSTLFISSILGSISNSLIPLLIGIFLDPNSLGIFNIADRIKGISCQLIQPLTHSVYPKIAKVYNESKKEGNKFLKHIFLITIPLMIIALILINFFIKDIVSYFSSENILIIIMILRILLFSFLINVIEEIMIYLYMIPNGLYNSINKLKVFILLTLAIFGIPLIINFGINGAAIANLISELLGLIYVIYKFQNTKLINNHKNIF